eukprot:CAMPEP_0119325204 /NCGR_PEP_ID=MMETSP1333-20130426/65211_1 /TAXON_ID=418940 /ORGANISM="Scyphosphaera apsteinii, Strain RCC1455" /LENGTH=683 /DNA_ID=CAMNT_0007333109 /DNA_START=135 /DNA_END=2186 /DNA_ORIENTATION=-
MALGLIPLSSAHDFNRPVDRYAHCAFVFREGMFVHGGRGFKHKQRSLSPLSDVWFFHLRRNSWTALLDDGPDNSASPGERYSHTCVLLREDETDATVIVFGGIVGGGGNAHHVVNDVWILNLRTNAKGVDEVKTTWERLNVAGDAPSPRFDHTAVKFHDSMLVYGGCVGSDAYGDVWLLQSKRLFDGMLAYSWLQLRPSSNSRPSLPLGAPQTLLNNFFDSSSGPTSPTQRCAHVAVPFGEGMLIFGGRTPAPATSGEVAWVGLADIWILNLSTVPNAAEGINGHKKVASTWRSVRKKGIADRQVLLNRSDHAAVIYGNQLLAFGGLYTDEREDNIYIMKDFLRIALMADDTSITSRLDWGPGWRFDHTLVLAPPVGGLLGGRGQASGMVPLLFGGYSGMDIFGDLWAYDLERNVWRPITPSGSAGAAATFISSLLFGTVGFVLYTCVIVCVFMRKIARSRRDTQSVLGDTDASPANGAPQNCRRAGIPQDLIDALPRMKWSDATQCNVSKKVADINATETSLSMPNVESDPPPAMSRGTLCSSSDTAEGAESSQGQHPSSQPTMLASSLPSVSASPQMEKSRVDTSSADSSESEVCSVCLSQYDANDLLIRLPCHHLFHEHCITRWLQQDGSCPQCRFHVNQQLDATAHNSDQAARLQDNQDVANSTDPSSGSSVRAADTSC